MLNENSANNGEVLKRTIPWEVIVGFILEKFKHGIV